MAKKPELTLINTKPRTELPAESADDFKQWVLVDGLKPSVALRKLMDKYHCPRPDVSVPVDLLQYTYPHIDLARDGFRFRMVDSAYPNSDPRQFSDEDFDQGIERLLSQPVGW